MRIRIESAIMDVAAAQAVVDALRPVAAQYPGTFVTSELARAKARLGEYQNDLDDVITTALADSYQPAGAVAR